MNQPTSMQALHQELLSLMRRKQELACEIQKCYQMLCQHDELRLNNNQELDRQDSYQSITSTDIDVEPLLKLRKHIMRVELEHENLMDLVNRVEGELDRYSRGGGKGPKMKKSNRSSRPRCDSLSECSLRNGRKIRSSRQRGDSSIERSVYDERRDRSSRQQEDSSTERLNCCCCCPCGNGSCNSLPSKGCLVRRRSGTMRTGSNSCCRRRPLRGQKSKENFRSSNTKLSKKRNRSNCSVASRKSNRRSSACSCSCSCSCSCTDSAICSIAPQILNCNSWEKSHPPKRVEIISVIVRVFPSSPGRKAGLRPGDLIVKFGDINAQNYNGNPSSLNTHAEAHENVRIPLTIFRGGKIIKKTLTPRKWSGCGLLGFRVGNVFK